MVKVNGKAIDVAGKTIDDFLLAENFDPPKIVVERNGEIVPKTQYRETVLADGDVVEVISFMGGGSASPKKMHKNKNIRKEII